VPRSQTSSTERAELMWGIWSVGELSNQDTFSDEGSFGTRAPRVRESALCKDAFDFKLDLDVEDLSIGEGVRAAAGLVFGFFLSVLAVT
jgi:hypothetical protein